MIKKIQKERANAVQRYLVGEAPESICASLGKTTRWLYKWVSRHSRDDPAWHEEHSRRPLCSLCRTPAEIEDIVEMVRLSLFNTGLFCGNQAIQWEMNDMAIQPIPSLSAIGRILRRRELTHRRTGRYKPKGKKYPEFPAMKPNQTHQPDFAGPCYLTGPTRFYSLNAIDIAINSVGLSRYSLVQRKVFWPLFMPFGSVWAFPKIFRQTMSWLSSEVQPIHEVWDHLFGFASTTEAICGSSHLPNLGVME